MIDAEAFAELFHETHQTIVKMNIKGYERASWEDLPGAARHALLATTKFVVPAIDIVYAETFATFVMALQERPELWRTFIHLARTRDAKEVTRGILGFMKSQRAKKQARGRP